MRNSTFQVNVDFGQYDICDLGLYFNYKPQYFERSKNTMYLFSILVTWISELLVVRLIFP